MPCKFVSHIKWPLKGTELEERSVSDGRTWLASRLPSIQFNGASAHHGGGSWGGGGRGGGGDCDVWWLGWTQAGMTGAVVVVAVT